jgi:hypothetical protein
VKEKVKVVRETVSGKGKVDMRQEFCLVNSTVQTTWKNRDKTVHAFDEN